MSKNRTYDVCAAISMIIALGLDVACSHDNADSHKEVTRVSAVKQALSTTDENHDHKVCNRPAPDYPLDFASANEVSIVGKNLVIPAQAREHKDPSGFTALAMVFDGEELSKIPLKPSWGTLASKGVLQIPINSIAPSGAKTERPITFAIEVTDASKATRWSDPMQIELVGNKWTVRAYNSDSAVPAASIRRGIKMQGDLPRVASPRPQIPADEILERFESDGDYRNLREKMEDMKASIKRSAAITTESIQGSEAMASGSPSTICLWQLVVMSNEGVGEDFLEFDWVWPSGGMYVWIVGPNFERSVFLDEWGCTTDLDITSGFYNVYAFSISSAWKVSNSLIAAVTHSSGVWATEWLGTFYLQAGEDLFIPSWPANWEHFNTNLFAVYGLHFNPGTETVLYLFNVLSTEGTHYSYNTGQIYLAPGVGQDKWTVIHEMGHAFLNKNTTNHTIINYDTNEPPCNCPESHCLKSKEYVTTAFEEGFASFYAAAAFNSMLEQDCWFGWGLQGINCADAQYEPIELPLAFMVNMCPSPFYTYGVELDWFRQLWRVRTWGIEQPSTNDMLDWIDTADSFNTGNADRVLDEAADVVEGPLNDNWDEFKDDNGIIHW